MDQTPCEILQLILSNVCRVSKKWNKVIKNDDFWRLLYKEYFRPVGYLSKTLPTWEEHFKFQLTLPKLLKLDTKKGINRLRSIIEQLDNDYEFVLKILNIFLEEQYSSCTRIIDEVYLDRPCGDYCTYADPIDRMMNTYPMCDSTCNDLISHNIWTYYSDKNHCKDPNKKEAVLNSVEMIQQLRDDLDDWVLTLIGTLTKYHDLLHYCGSYLRGIYTINPLVVKF